MTTTRTIEPATAKQIDYLRTLQARFAAESARQDEATKAARVMWLFPGADSLAFDQLRERQQAELAGFYDEISSKASGLDASKLTKAVASHVIEVLSASSFEIERVISAICSGMENKVYNLSLDAAANVVRKTAARFVDADAMTAYRAS